MRLVLDTSVVVSAFRSRSGASYALLDLLHQRKFIGLVSQALFLEYEMVLKRPEQYETHQIADERMEELIQGMAAAMRPVAIHYNYRPQLRDANDEMVLEAAINASADAIVTHNVRDFLPAAHNFGISVLTPGRILKERLKP